MKFVVVGLGYVGLSISLLLSKKHTVIGIDISKKKISQLKNKKSPIKDQGITETLNQSTLFFPCDSDIDGVVDGSVDAYIIAVPTDSSHVNQSLNVSIVEETVQKIKRLDNSAFIVIKSTVPVGYTEQLSKQLGVKDVIFSPEFLREGSAFEDNLCPSRIVVGDEESNNKWFGEILLDLSNNKNVPVLHMNSSEAEAIKLFSNAYLAMRVAFFNELDTFTESKNLDTKNIIEGVSLDPRIGNFYNNPSFGYGGYCLPKDSEELGIEFLNIPNTLISSINKSNEIRIQHIVKKIISTGANVVGVYRLSMKLDSDNSRTSAIIKIINLLQEQGISVVVFDDRVKKSLYKIPGVRWVSNLNELKKIVDLIISNRRYSELNEIKNLYTRDVFTRD